MRWFTKVVDAVLPLMLVVLGLLGLLFLLIRPMRFLILFLAFVGFASSGFAGEHRPEVSLVTTTAVRVDLLDRFADKLTKLAPTPEKLDMTRWSNQQPTDDYDFVGCALGWATRWFADEGLVLREWSMPNGQSAGLIPVYQGLQGEAAGAAFFGISRAEANELFSGRQMVANDPLSVARRVRSIANRERLRRARLDSRKFLELAWW